MKKILVDPLIVPLLLSLGILFLAIAFHTFGRNIKYAMVFERICLGLFLITISGATGATIQPFSKFHPRVLSNPSVTPPTMIIQIAVYGVAIILLTPIFRYSLKNIIDVFVRILVSDPFFFSFLLLILLSFFWSNDPTLTLKVSLVILETAVFAIYFGQRYTWQELFQILLWVHLVLVLLGFFYGLKDGGTWTGINGHKNQFCFLMLLNANFWFIKSLYFPKQRRFCIFVILLSIIALNQGGSGAGKVIMVVLGGLWFYLGFIKTLPVRWAFTSVILFMIVGICIVLVVSNNLEYIVVDVLNKDMTLTGRTDFWPLIIKKINENPLLGYGIDGFWQPWRGDENPANDIIVAKTQFKPPHAHNGFMDLAVDLGYVGLALFIASFVSSIAKGVIYLGKAKMPDAGLPLLLLTFTLLTNITETGLLGVTSIFFWYVVVVTRLSLDAF